MSNQELPNHSNQQNHSNGQYNGMQHEGVRGGINPHSYNDTEDEIDLKKILITLWRNKYILIGITFLGMIAAGINLHYSIPIYSSTGTMVIAEARNRYSYTGSDLSNLLTSTYGIGAGSTISNELETMRSIRMAMEIAAMIIQKNTDEKGNLLPILWRDWPHDSTIVAQSSIAGRIRSNVTIERVSRDADLVRLTFESPSPYEAKFIVDTFMDTYSTLSTEQNRRSTTAARHFLEEELERVSNSLKDSENELLSFMDQTGIIQIDAQSSSLIAMITRLEQEKQAMQVRKVMLESKLKTNQEQLDQITPGLAERIIDSPGGRINRFQYRLSELETERLLLFTRNPGLSELREQPEEIVRLDRQIEAVKNEIRTLSEEVLKGDDVFLSLISGTESTLIAQVTRLRAQLIETNLELLQVTAQEEVLNRQLEQFNREVDNLPESMVQLARLRRDVSITERLYITMAQQFSEVSLWEQTQFGLGVPLDYGNEPRNPVKPKPVLIFLIGTIFGGILGVGLVFLKELMNQTVRSTEELKKGGLSLLSVVPDMNIFVKREFKGEEYTSVRGRAVSTHLITLLDNISPTAESFRRMKNNILFAHPDKQIKTIMVTSSTMGEGKTTVAANLAVTFAEAGKKVLIIDLDFRRPALHKMFGCKQRPGVTEYLFGESELSEAIQPTVIDGVHVLACGSRPPDPAAVVQSKKLKELINSLKGDYDYVVFDTAPYGIITDAAPLIYLSDGVILLSRFNYTNREHFYHTLENLKHIRAYVLGTVLTAFDPKQSTDYYSQDYYKKSYYAAAEYK